MQRDDHRSGQAPLPTVPPALEQLLLGLQPLALPLHAPLALPEPLQALLVLLQLLLQLLSLPPQSLSLQVALPLPLLQLALLLLLLVLPSLELSLPALSLLAQLTVEPLRRRHLLPPLLQVTLLLLFLQGGASDTRRVWSLDAGRRAFALTEEQLLHLITTVLHGHCGLGWKQKDRLEFMQMY